MKTILNLTQHPASREQVVAGVFDVPAEEGVNTLLTFDELPTRLEISKRADTLAELAKKHGATMCMIGGAPYLMPALERALGRFGIDACYAFSKRISVEEVQADGSVKKSSIFKHGGFINV